FMIQLSCGSLHIRRSCISVASSPVSRRRRRTRNCFFHFNRYHEGFVFVKPQRKHGGNFLWNIVYITTAIPRHHPPICSIYTIIHFAHPRSSIYFFLKADNSFEGKVSMLSCCFK